MKLNEFNNAFQTEQDCLKYIASLKKNKCIMCSWTSLNTSNLRRIRCLKCHQTFSILHGTIFLQVTNTFEILILSHLKMNKHQTWNYINWCCKRIGCDFENCLKNGSWNQKSYCQTRTSIYCWGHSANGWNVSFTYGF
ncbi:hypothetical protein [Spiroplasma ixodetis]|uniref:hypothetical protein n=2 Tax=Spiroplasma ixodetis TaxID=2141 RepID=UPI0025779E98|nr:hypothetical protein [Spiroplasma ixodetis]